MAQPTYTPIQLYYSTTAAAVPVNTNLASGELAINITDGILFYKDNGGTVQKIGYKLTPTTAGGTGLTSFTANGVVYASSTSALATGSALTYDGTNFTAPRTQITTAGTPPASGAGFEIVGGTSPVILAYNRGTSAYLPFTQYGSAFTWSINGSSSDLVLNSSGNLLVGNSSDPIGSNRLLVQSAGTANNNRTMTVYNSAATSTTGFANRILNLSSLGSGADVSIAFTDSVANNAYIGMGSGALYFGVNSSATKAMTLDASGNLQLQKNMSVGGATPTTSGTGITFPATQSASTNANTLDDYEEGTWTPVAIGTTTAGTGTYTTQSGSYTKVGRLVTIICEIAWSAHTGTGNVVIGGLPFINAGLLSVGAVYASNMNFGTSATQLTAFVINSDNNISFRGMINNAGRADTPIDSSIDNLSITLSYQSA